MDSREMSKRAATALAKAPKKAKKPTVTPKHTITPDMRCCWARDRWKEHHNDVQSVLRRLVAAQAKLNPAVVNYQGVVHFIEDAFTEYQNCKEEPKTVPPLVPVANGACEQLISKSALGRALDDLELRIDTILAGIKAVSDLGLEERHSWLHKKQP
jgi:hypothetical protein